MQSSFKKKIMKNTSITLFLWLLILPNILAQEYVNYEFQNKNETDQGESQFKKNRFTVLLGFPTLGLSNANTNVFQGIGTEFDYNFSEIMSLGLHISFYNEHITNLDEKKEEKHQTLNFAPVFKLNFGKNQVFVPFLKASYILSIGKRYCSYEENYTPNYMRHIISGGVGLKIYASRWFKKTKCKNNFGMELCFSKALFLFDNSINVPLNEREGFALSFFYRF